MPCREYGEREREGVREGGEEGERDRNRKTGGGISTSNRRRKASFQQIKALSHIR